MACTQNMREAWRSASLGKCPGPMTGVLVGLFAFCPALVDARADDVNSGGLDQVEEESVFETPMEFNGYLRFGGAYFDNPSSSPFAVPGVQEKQLIGFSEVEITSGMAFEQSYFESQFYLRGATEAPLTFNDSVEVAVPRLNWNYFGDRYDFVIGRTHVPAGLARFANVVDFFSDNPITTAIPLGEVDRGLRTGQVALGVVSFSEWSDILVEAYLIPEIQDLSFENEPLLSSNSVETYAWLRASSDFSNGLHLEIMTRLHPKDWRVGTNMSFGLGDKFILYSEAAYRNLRPLPTIDPALTSVEFNSVTPNASGAIGVTYAPVRSASVTFEIFAQEGGYSQAEQDRLFDVLADPANPIFATVVAEFPTENPIGKYRFGAEADIALFEDRLRLVPNVTFAQDGSGRVTVRALYHPEIDGLTFDARLTGNFGSERTEFGSAAQMRRLAVSATYTW